MNSPWIYIVVIGLVLIVYSRFLPKTAASGQPQLKQEVEETIGHFAAEIEAENRELVQLISAMRKEHEAQTSTLAKRIDTLEKQVADYAAQLQQLAAAAPSGDTSRVPKEEGEPRQAQEHEAQHRQAVPPQPVAREEREADAAAALDAVAVPLMNIKARYPELFRLYEQGKSVDAIAKKLEMNKGEVSLILQLARQEERVNA